MNDLNPAAAKPDTSQKALVRIVVALVVVQLCNLVQIELASLALDAYACGANYSAIFFWLCERLVGIVAMAARHKLLPRQKQPDRKDKILNLP